MLCVRETAAMEAEAETRPCGSGHHASEHKVQSSLCVCCEGGGPTAGTATQRKASRSPVSFLLVSLLIRSTKAPEITFRARGSLSSFRHLDRPPGGFTDTVSKACSSPSWVLTDARFPNLLVHPPCEPGPLPLPCRRNCGEDFLIMTRDCC